MRSMLLTSLATTALAVFAVPTAALADDCETTNSCGAPPTAPTLGAASGQIGGYRLYGADGALVRTGFVQDGQATVLNGGPYHDIGGDGTVRDSIAGAGITLKGTLTPDATSAATASAGAHQTSGADLYVSYLVEVHAANDAAFAAFSPFLGISGAIGHIDGQYTLSATGDALSQATAYTGTALSDTSLEQSMSSTCDYSGLFGSAAACGTAHYTLDLNFRAGSSFTDGDAHSIYGSIVLFSAAFAGLGGTGGPGGEASAFIDPTITLNPLFNTPLYTLNVGNAVGFASGGGAVPEPASWAMMLFGFGLTGLTVRRTARQTVVVA